MSDTPESDNFEKHFPDAPVSGWKRLAKRFERERDEVRGELEEILETYRNVINEKCGEYEQHCTCVPALRAEITDLRRWKAEALSVMPDFQAIGREIGLTLGESVTDKILPELIRRREEIELLREAFRKPHPASPGYSSGDDNPPPRVFGGDGY